MANDVNLQATITDADGVVWSGAAWILTIVGYVSTYGRPPTYLSTGLPVVAHHSGNADQAGHFAVSIAANNAIVPFGTRWELTIQPLAPVAPSSFLFTTAAGVDVDLSSLITQSITPISQGATNSNATTQVLPAANEAEAIAESIENTNNIYYWT